MLIEIICKLTAIKHTSVVTSKQVLAWARQVEGQRNANCNIRQHKRDNRTLMPYNQGEWVKK